MHPNIIALREALEELHIPYKTIDSFDDALMVRGYAFIRASTPFNTGSLPTLCQDKDALYKVCVGAVPTPRTYGFFTHQSFDEILRISRDILYPRIVKMNKGERGHHVFLCHSDEETSRALTLIFKDNSKHTDYIALIQEYILPKTEIRAVVVYGKVVLIYDRYTRIIMSGDIVLEVERMCTALASRIHLGWVAVDFIQSMTGSLYFVEINTKPGFDGFIEIQGTTEIKKIYMQALTHFFSLT